MANEMTEGRTTSDYERGQRDMQRRAADAVSFWGDIPTWQERSVMEATREVILALPIKAANHRGNGSDAVTQPRGMNA